MSRAERARQFMPFAALRGFETLINEQSREVCRRREMPEEHAARLSARIGALERGRIVTVEYYAENAYLRLCGMVSEIDIPMRMLRIVKKRIPFDDIWDLWVNE